MDRYEVFLQEINQELKDRGYNLSTDDFPDYNFETDFRLLMTVAETVDELLVWYEMEEER
jgi:hypothetical protein